MRYFAWYHFIIIPIDFFIHLTSALYIASIINNYLENRKRINVISIEDEEEVLLLPESIEEQRILSFIDRNNGQVERKKLLSSYLFGKGAGAKVYDLYINSLIRKNRIGIEGKNKTQQKYFIT